MRLGVVGFLPGDIRSFETDHFRAICRLGFTGAGFHFPGDRIGRVGRDDIHRARTLFGDHGVELAQFAITYSDCLFDPDPEARGRIAEKIALGADIAAGLGAQTYLLRPGSRNPAGPWTPHRDNHRPGAMERLTGTLKNIAPRLETAGVTAVVETHAISILNTPEACRALVEAVGSPRIRLVMDFVNHFESLHQVYNSRARIERIFDAMGALAPVCHVKDIAVGSGLVLHLDETVPGEGELDLAAALRRFHAHHPEGYALVEHLPPDLIPRAAENVRRIASEAGVPIR